MVHQKIEVVRFLRDANQPKSRLIDLQRKLEEIGAKRKALQLGKIIWRLESWQNS